MTLGAQYATAAEYRQRVTKADTTDDTLLDSQLIAVSHYIDARCRRKDGFNQSASPEARTYDINRSPALGAAYTSDYLRLHLPHDVATVTGLVVKCDINGDYTISETLTINTDFWIGPANAAVGADPAPYTYLDIKPTSTLISSWPIQRRALEVTATFGWPEIPEAIKEATVMFTRQLRDLQEAGSLLSIENIETAVQQSPQGSAFLLDIVRRYGKGPGF